MTVTTKSRRKKKLTIRDRSLFSELPTPTAARALLKLQFAEDDKARMHDLSAKSRAGALTASERDEIEMYEQLACVLDILHSKARQALKRRTQ